jgi:hypothetical protein
LADQLQGYDPNDPKAYLMYLAFDQKMNLLPDQSGAVPVTDPNELELLEASITMPESGYFYTFLTNYSVISVGNVPFCRFSIFKKITECKPRHKNQKIPKKQTTSWSPVSFWLPIESFNAQISPAPKR